MIGRGSGAAGGFAGAGRTAVDGDAIGLPAYLESPRDHRGETAAPDAAMSPSPRPHPTASPPRGLHPHAGGPGLPRRGGRGRRARPGGRRGRGGGARDRVATGWASPDAGTREPNERPYAPTGRAPRIGRGGTGLPAAVGQGGPGADALAAHPAEPAVLAAPDGHAPLTHSFDVPRAADLPMPPVHAPAREDRGPHGPTRARYANRDARTAEMGRPVPHPTARHRVPKDARRAERQRGGTPRRRTTARGWRPGPGPSGAEPAGRVMQAALDVAGRRDPSIVAGSGPGRPDDLPRPRERGSAREGHPAPTEPATRREVGPRFVAGEPLRRRHAWVAVVLAMTSGPIDPRLEAGLGLAMARATGDPGPAWPAGGGARRPACAGRRTPPPAAERTPGPAPGNGRAGVSSA